MLELAYEPDAFAMRAGKVLEAICSDQGYVKGNLGPRLDKLIADDRLPQALGDQAHLVREYRNIGSHDDGSLDVETEDVPLIRDFVESLLDYLYWRPAKLQRVKSANERRRVSPPRHAESDAAPGQHPDSPSLRRVYRRDPCLRFASLRRQRGQTGDRSVAGCGQGATVSSLATGVAPANRLDRSGKPWNLSALIRHIIQEATGEPPQTSPWGLRLVLDPAHVWQRSRSLCLTPSASSSSRRHCRYGRGWTSERRSDRSLGSASRATACAASMRGASSHGDEHSKQRRGARAKSGPAMSAHDV